jgi:hypothetical protein
MVVVEEARDLIGSEVDVTVTNVLQTSTGRMVFAALATSEIGIAVARKAADGPQDEVQGDAEGSAARTSRGS